LILQGEQPTTLKCDIRYHFFLRHFKNNYNYKFGLPRKDICVTCSELEAFIELENLPVLKKEHILKLKVHKRKAKKLYLKLDEMTKIAKENDEVDVLCFDFKQNMPLPHLQISDIFYIYIKTCKSIMNCWPEIEARRGANEVISVF
jgi:hypothetical protein